MKDKEYCCKCWNETGKAGRHDDSLFTDNGEGPYCENCWDIIGGGSEMKKEHGGKTYVTVPAQVDGSCQGCAAQHDSGLCDKLHTDENGMFTPNICALVGKIFKEKK